MVKSARDSRKKDPEDGSSPALPIGIDSQRSASRFVVPRRVRQTGWSATLRHKPVQTSLRFARYLGRPLLETTHESVCSASLCCRSRVERLRRCPGRARSCRWSAARLRAATRRFRRSRWRLLPLPRPPRLPARSAGLVPPPSLPGLTWAVLGKGTIRPAFRFFGHRVPAARPRRTRDRGFDNRVRSRAAVQ